MSKSHGTTDNRPSLGRPMKGKDRRIQVGVYIPGSVLDTIENYVEQRQATERGYSRSDFINEAITKHMTDLGMIGGDDDAKE